MHNKMYDVYVAQANARKYKRDSPQLQIHKTIIFEI